MVQWPVLLLHAVGLVGAAVHFPRAEAGQDNYSSCFADRGYTDADALEAASFLWQNATFVGGLEMAKKACIYKHVNTTIVSLCNGSGRNRTVYQNEVRRGIAQLIKDCGGDGAFSGVHVVNNLTFAAYGVLGGRNLAVPSGSPPPDLPATKARDDVDPCATMGWDGTVRTDCLKPAGHTIVDGVCGDPNNPSEHCQAYCEEKRIGLIGLESIAPSPYGDAQLPHQGISLEQGHEISITTGFSIGIEGVYEEVIGGGVSFEWSITDTKSNTITRSAEPSDFWTRWVYFPAMVETCGKVSMRTYNPPLPCNDLHCTGTSSGPTCSGDIITKDICSITAFKKDGLGVDLWVQRFENSSGYPLPIDQQSQMYRELCATDFDKDHTWECASHPDGNPP